MSRRRSQSGLRSRESHLRARRQSRARRQAARLAALALLLGGLLLLVLCLGGVLWYRQVQAARARLAAQPDRLPPPRIETALSRRLRPAPWFIAVDSQRAYIATGAAREAADLSGYPLAGLQALPLDGGGTLWEKELSGRYSAMAQGGACLALLRELPQGGLKLEAFSNASGAPAWNLDFPGASLGSLAAAEGTLLLSSWTAPQSSQESGWSISAFRGADGKRLWRISRRLAGLRETPGEPGPPRIRLSAWPGACGYQIGNLAGLVRLSNGSVLSEFAGAGPVLDLQFDPALRQGFALCGGSKAGEFLVEAMPPGKNDPAFSLCRFEAAAPGIAMLASGGWVVVAYPHLQAGKIAPMLRAYRAGPAMQSRKAVFSTRFEGGTPAGLAAVAGANGEFLLGLNEGDGSAPGGGGPSSLRRIRLRGEQKAWEVQRYKAGLERLQAFKHDCLLLLSDGSVERYQPEEDRSARLERLGFDELGLLSGSDGSTLAITAYPPEYLAGQPGRSLDLLVLK